jgi:regulation of enolase protein 1 (concanavalin A-like superfamily)
VKCGIELEHDRPWASAVVTRDRSDWSLAPLPESFDPSAGLMIRLHRRGDAVEVDWALPGGPVVPLRLASLSEAPTWRVGPLAASPSRAGFVATFHEVSIGPPEPTAP